MNNKGQEMIVGVMIMVMAVIIFIATIPAMKSMFDNARGCSYLNCGGYKDAKATGAGCGSSNQTAIDSLEEDTLSCTILDLGIPYLILGVLVALIGKLIHGKLVEAPQPSYAEYGAGY